MYIAFRGIDDIRNKYIDKTSKGLLDRLFKIYYLYRQPRPHISISIYSNMRAQLIQKTEPVEIVMDYKMTSLRKERYNAFRKNMYQTRR